MTCTQKRINQLKIYLCGPINGCTDEECNDWRGLVTAFIPGEWEAVDPMRRDYRGREAESYREIVELDKRDVRECDAVVVSYSKPSVGTSMEVFYAWTLGVPVVVVCAEDTVMSPWLRYHSTAILHSYDDCVTWLREALG